MTKLRELDDILNEHRLILTMLVDDLCSISSKIHPSNDSKIQRTTKLISNLVFKYFY